MWSLTSLINGLILKEFGWEKQEGNGDDRRNNGRVGGNFLFVVVLDGDDLCIFKREEAKGKGRFYAKESKVSRS